MNQEDIKSLNECLEILTDGSCNYQRTALQLKSILRRNKLTDD